MIPELEEALTEQMREVRIWRRKERERQQLEQEIVGAAREWRKTSQSMTRADHHYEKARALRKAVDALKQFEAEQEKR